MSSRPIGIWLPESRRGETVFVRPEPLPLGDHHAARREIPAAKSDGLRRICFFGESAAAGYLYAPHLTPAKVLEDQLGILRKGHGRTGEAGFEVVDLARVNETLGSLAETIESSLQLDPDLLVIFTGNNWSLLETPEVSPYFPSTEGRRVYGRALSERGVAGPVELAARRWLEKAGAVLERIANAASEAAVPVILVIPEVNLADWENRQPVPWLAGDGTGRWHRLLEGAISCLEKEEWSAAAEAAKAMVELDDGLCPTAWRILSRAAEGEGDQVRARAYAEAEVDASHYASSCFLGAPRASSMAKELQRRAALRHGFSVVDLPELFAQITASLLPGRHLFLDYCHLSDEGIKIAMAAVASEILKVSGEGIGSMSVDGLIASLPDPSIPPEAEATARLGAAIHTAHRLVPLAEKGSILDHWCRAALEASSGVRGAMLDLVAARSAPCPAVLTAAQRRNFASPYRLGHQHGWRCDHLDAEMIEAITLALDGDAAARDEIRSLLLEHHAIGPGSAHQSVELAADPFFHREPLERFYPELMDFRDLPRRAFYRSPWPVSRFSLITDGTSDVLLDLTARLPAIPGWEEERKGPVKVEVNGRRVGVLEVKEKWHRESLRVAKEHLRAGLNRVNLGWPPLPPAGDAALESAAARLHRGLDADIHPVFGEIFSLRATASRSEKRERGQVPISLSRSRRRIGTCPLSQLSGRPSPGTGSVTDGCGR